MGRVLNAPSLDDIRRARERIGKDVVRTPLVRIDTGDVDAEVWLKLENLQPIGSFKIRGALSLIRTLDPKQLGDGVYTASAGNMAQGVAWAARELRIPATVIVPDTAPRAKLDALQRLGASIVSVPYAEWWSTMQNGGRAGMRGTFIHPFADELVMAGNGTIGLEIVEDLPTVDTVFIPWGGGGLTCGIASAIRSISRDARVYACEVDGAAPLSASLRAGKPVAIENQRSFIDGIGGRGVFPELWSLARRLVTDALTASVGQVADALRLIATRAHTIAEGAGAAPLAAARAHASALSPRPARIVCVVSGGNIDASVLASILSGSIPE